MVALCDPDVEFRSRIASAEGVTYQDHAGRCRRFHRGLARPGRAADESLKVIDGGDRAVVCNRFRARGRHSGVEVEERFVQALRYRDGKVLWWGFYPSRIQALEAVGLTEQDALADS